AYIRPLFCRGIGPFRRGSLYRAPPAKYKNPPTLKYIFADHQQHQSRVVNARQRIKIHGQPARKFLVGLDYL
ncbi:urocanate hydratase, partial [Enterobacter hormaechei]